MESPSNKKRCFGYIRVSTTMQVEEGISLENQESKIKAWCVFHDYELVKIYADKGISGRDIAKRKQLQELLECIEAGDTLVVYSFSRLSRSVKDFLHITTMLSERSCNIVILKENFDTTTPHGKFSATMMSAMAQLESDMTSERVKDAMKHKMSKNEHVGRPPYGWRVAGTKGSGLIQNQAEQTIIRRIRKMRHLTIGKRPMSYLKIAERLNEDGIPPPRNSKKWYHSTISRIYNREHVVTNGRENKEKDPVVKELDAEYEKEKKLSSMDLAIQQIDKDLGIILPEKSE